MVVNSKTIKLIRRITGRWTSKIPWMINVFLKTGEIIEISSMMRSPVNIQIEGNEIIYIEIDSDNDEEYVIYNGSEISYIKIYKIGLL